MKPVKPGVFRAYDIRGIVDRDFDAEWVRLLGRACGTYCLRAGQRHAVLAHDCRHSSPAYARALAHGMAQTGMDCIDIGMAPTPLAYFAIRHLDLGAGVIVTASHNPPDHNGFKIWCGRTTIHSEAIQDIRRLMLAEDFETGTGVLSTHDMAPAYVETLAQDVTLARPVKVVLDGGNGAAGPLCAALLRAAGAEVIELYCRPDGDFPNHHPDPVVAENIRDLQAAVLEHKAHAGFGLDGDGDRLGVVDETGQIVPGDRITAILAREILARTPGVPILGDVKCSHLLFNDIEHHGGEPIMSVTGHSIVKARMLETGAALGGEMSGHLFFKDRFYGHDDACYAALRLTELLGNDFYGGRPLSAWLDDWPETHATPELRAPCPEAVKFALVDRIREAFRTRLPVIEIDGARIQYPDGWALVRASNTQPVLSMRFEAETADALQRIQAEVQDTVDALTAELTAELTENHV